MKVLITGANGMVARAATKHCLSIGDEVVALTRQQMDIADRDAVFRVIGLERPDAVLNCAAYTDVDGAETDPGASRAANTDGVRFLAEATREFDAQFVTISTDYIFDGENDGFYTEDAKPNPRGVYAETKYAGELEAGRANERSVIVRSGWIYGTGGTNFLSVMHLLLGEGKQIKAIKDSYGTPTYALDLAKRLRELAAMDAVGIYHVTNAGDGTSYLGFAEKVCELGGFDPGLIEAVAHEELKRPAPRPVSSKLASIKGLPPIQNWEDALGKFLEQERDKN